MMEMDRKTAEAGTSAAYRLPRWVLGWFYSTAVICTWDAAFILLRPYTLPGGVLFFFWRPCKYTLADGFLCSLRRPCQYTTADRFLCSL